MHSSSPDHVDDTSKPFSHYFEAPRADNFDPRRARLRTMNCAGLSLELRTGSGIFARSGLDAGSRLLIETFGAQAVITTGSRICDLGCGWGAVGCFVAARYPVAVAALVDINRHAVAVARTNLDGNQLENAVAWCGDGLSAARPQYFDAVLCNPPVRAGNQAIEKLFVEAQRCLVPDGALWIVLRTQQGAKSWQKRLAQQFGNCDAPAIESGYRVLKSVNCKVQSAK